MIILDNMRCLGDLFFGGVCHRFPDLKFVSVESGVGWLPGVLETFDWQWRNGGIGVEHPEYDLLPSEYFRRQVYGCFWFERQAALERHRALARQHPLRDGLPAPDLPAPRAPDTGPAPPGLRHRGPRRAVRRGPGEGPPRQRRRPVLPGVTRQAGWLADRHVVDLTEGIAGAYATKLLADAGADVTLVEPADGHPLRRWSASGSPTGDAGPLFRFLSAGKASLLAPASDAVAVADLVVTGAEVPEGVRDDAVVVSITPYGTTGPWAGRPATDFVIQAESGSIAFRGRRDQPPVAAGGRLGEWVTGAYAAVAALGAPPGERVDVSELETMTLAGSLFLDLMWSLVGLEPSGPARSLELPSIEPTRDGWVGFNTNTRQQFDDFLILIERPDLLGVEEWVSVQARVARMAEWNPIVHAWTTQHTTAEIVERAAALRIPVAPVVSGAGVGEIDHFVERGVFVDDATGTFRHPRSPYALDGVRADTTRPAPDLGSTSPQSSFWWQPRVVGDTGLPPERRARAAVGGRAGHRRHGVVGRARGRAAAGAPGGRRRAPGDHAPARRHAPGRRAVRRQAPLVGAVRHLAVGQRRQARHHARPDPGRRAGAARPPAGRRRRAAGELQPPGGRALRADARAPPRPQPRASSTCACPPSAWTGRGGTGSASPRPWSR